MAFKKKGPGTQAADSPEELFLNLPRRKIPDVLPHQREMMRAYASTAAELQDVALQLPTGSGKTLVGLIIAEWRRRAREERVVYLCPTRQLVNQVVAQAEDKYGLTALAFTGRIRDYDPTARAQYRDADHVAVTTYSSLFNVNPFFDDADVLILDDAHAAEQYIAANWSLLIDREDPDHAPLHAAVCGILQPHVQASAYARLAGEAEGVHDRAWVDKLPTPTLAAIRDSLIEVLDVHAPSLSVRYAWSTIREHLHACHLYISSSAILIRPLIPPTWSHRPFNDPSQRIYMSATLGEGGDLERMMGRSPITRLPTPEGWDRQGVGRRFFVFPGMSLRDDEVTDLRRKMVKRAGRSLVLVPSSRTQERISADLSEGLGFSIFSANDIENSKAPFVNTPNSVAIVANRYDGIDFPGDECRLLLIDGLPKATNLQERFLMSRMAANLIFNERVQTRVLQAIGRCTRSLEDYSAVVVSGEELTDYLADRRRRRFLHPELQAEIGFGVEQSKEMSAGGLLENLDIFLANGREWEEVNEEIVAERRKLTREHFPAMGELGAVAGAEIAFQTAMWQEDFEAALGHAERVLGALTAPELKGYRALWHYLAGSAAGLGASAGSSGMEAKARSQFRSAKQCAPGVPWLVALSRFQEDTAGEEPENPGLMSQIEGVESVLAGLGTVHDRKFAMRERFILEGIVSEDTSKFERAQKSLGELLGFDADKVEEEGSPDPWWIASGVCFVFEDWSGAGAGAALSVTKARQVSSHPAWMKENVPACANAETIPVLVTGASKVRSAALPHLDGVALWKLDEYVEWAKNALAVIRELRVKFMEPGDLAWRADAADSFQRNGMDAESLRKNLRANPASEGLTEE